MLGTGSCKWGSGGNTRGSPQPGHCWVSSAKSQNMKLMGAGVCEVTLASFKNQTQINL